MRLVFMGTAEFAVPSLSAIARSEHTILSVVTAPDLPRGRGQKVTFTPVKKEAVKLGLPVIQPENLRDPEFIKTIQMLKPDLIVVIAFRILPKEIFTIPKFGSFNLHASLLPKYRGAAPINWAIIRGEKETGVTTFYLKEKVDTGNIILQNKIDIGDNENAGELHDRLSSLGADTIIETIRMIEQNKAYSFNQDESFATTAPKIFKETCRINWSLQADALKNFIRGLSPYPCASTVYHDDLYKIFGVSVSEEFHDALPGTIVELNQKKGIGVVTGDKKIVYILELQPPSKKRMSVTDFLRGYGVHISEIFS